VRRPCQRQLREARSQLLSASQCQCSCTAPARQFTRSGCSARVRRGACSRYLRAVVYISRVCGWPPTSLPPPSHATRHAHHLGAGCKQHLGSSSSSLLCRIALEGWSGHTRTLLTPLLALMLPVSRMPRLVLPLLALMRQPRCRHRPLPLQLLPDPLPLLLLLLAQLLLPLHRVLLLTLPLRQQQQGQQQREEYRRQRPQQ